MPSFSRYRCLESLNPEPVLGLHPHFLSFPDTFTVPTGVSPLVMSPEWLIHPLAAPESGSKWGRCQHVPPSWGPACSSAREIQAGLKTPVSVFAGSLQGTGSPPPPCLRWTQHPGTGSLPGGRVTACEALSVETSPQMPCEVPEVPHDF